MSPRTLSAEAPAEVTLAFNRLSARQRQFALCLPHARTQEEAMLEAGYAPQTARKQAATLAGHPDVQTVLRFLVGGALAEQRDSLDRVLQEACAIALADPLGMLDDNDNVRPLREWPEDLRRALSGLDVEELFEGRGEDREHVGRVKKIKFWNKPQTLELIAKIRGYLRPEKVEHIHRVEGLAGILKEINGAGTGPGPG